MSRERLIGHAVIKVRFLQAGGDDAQTLADRHRPGFAAKADERDAWKTLDEQAKAYRVKQSRAASLAADLILRRGCPMRGE